MLAKQPSCPLTAMRSALPKNIRENIARAKGYVSRNELSRALDTMSVALREMGSATLSRAARFEAEAHCTEILQDVRYHPVMRPLLDPQNTGELRAIPYQRGKEGTLAAVLEGLAKILTEAAARQEGEARQAEDQRRDGLIAIGVEALQGGDVGRGCSFLRRAVAEFGHQPGLCMQVGRHMLDAQRYADAAQIFEVGLDKFPKESEAYSAAVNAYMLALEYAKAEAVFKKILRQFGGHASTYGRMAEMYLGWHKRMKAEEFAVRALQMDKEQAEALAVLQKIERKS